MDDNLRELERFKAELLSSLEHYKATIKAQQDAWLSDRDDGRILLRAVIDFANMTIRSLILVNGGAAIGILTFLGNLWNKDSVIAKAGANAIGVGLAGFIGGLTFALITSGVSYLAQAAFSELPRQGENPPSKRWGNRLRVVAIFFALLSLISFIFGAVKCMIVFAAPAFLK